VLAIEPEYTANSAGEFSQQIIKEDLGFGPGPFFFGVPFRTWMDVDVDLIGTGGNVGRSAARGFGLGAFVNGERDPFVVFEPVVIPEPSTFVLVLSVALLPVMRRLAARQTRS
jgi:hypothetical protein